MKTVLDDAFAYAVLSIVEEIPVGTVATYGQIARLLGMSRGGRRKTPAWWLGSCPTPSSTDSSPVTGWSTTPDGWRLGGRNKRHCWRRRAWCAGMRATWI